MLFRDIINFPVKLGGFKGSLLAHILEQLIESDAGPSMVYGGTVAQRSGTSHGPGAIALQWWTSLIISPLPSTYMHRLWSSVEKGI